MLMLPRSTDYAEKGVDIYVYICICLYISIDTRSTEPVLLMLIIINYLIVVKVGNVISLSLEFQTAGVLQLLLRIDYNNLSPILIQFSVR